jgi:uncharacterized Zn finger protein (UPF0148 family)
LKRRGYLSLVVLAVILGLVGVALARPGGGESYSGGGGHSGGGSSSGGGGGGGGIVDAIQLIIWIIELCIYHPFIALVLVVGIGLFVAYSAYKQKVNKDWDSGPPVSLQRAVDLGGLRRVDPDFSQIVFEDFVFRLFSTAHRARHSPEALAAIAPYVGAKARRSLADRDPIGVPVKQVIVGALRVVHATVPNRPAMADETPDLVRLSVELEANVATAEKTYFSVETWQLVRDARQLTKPPGSQNTFPCPNCGAPWKSTDTATQTCASCGQVVDNGRFDWVVEAITLESIDERPPTLTTDVPERGTELETYKAPNVDKVYAALKKTDPTVDQHGLNARIALIYKDLGEAWSKNDIAPVRGLVSDGLYDYLDYWVTAYKQQGLRNLMRDTKITRSELAKVVSDRWYDAVTMRIWATGLDYVIDEKSGRVVRGSKRKPRPYSEYWTLIRSSQRKGPTVTSRTCGNCGAPLDVTMAGACTHCGAHVTGGEFDRILSKIEQDDSYRG